jgi:IS30 family transposase
VRAIARELGRPPSTVSRELRRNRDDYGRYRPHTAHEQARTRRARPRPRRVATDPVLRAMVEDLLGVKWSPEQIAHELSVRCGHDRSRRLCAESIYQAIYDPNTPLQRPARTALRTRRRRRRPHPTGTQRRGRLRDMTMIEQRPAEVADRAVAGHWEGDLIMGAGNRSAIATLVERASRYVVLVHLPDGHTANWVRDGVVAAFTALPVSLRRTLTWDQGKEMAQHLEITAATGMPVYFCHAHSPWQRGSNENMNGLLRQYFPKGSDLSRHTAEDLATAQMQLNTRPRKTLQWATPDALVGALLSTPSADDRCDDP